MIAALSPVASISLCTGQSYKDLGTLGNRAKVEAAKPQASVSSHSSRRCPGRAGAVSLSLLSSVVGLAIQIFYPHVSGASRASITLVVIHITMSKARWTGHLERPS